MKAVEQLYDCPACGAAKLNVAGLRVHDCRKLGRVLTSGECLAALEIEETKRKMLRAAFGPKRQLRKLRDRLAELNLLFKQSATARVPEGKEA